MTNRQERNQDATVYVGDLDGKVNEALLWELMLQAGPVVNVYIPKDKLTQQHAGYGFVEFVSEEDADYAIKIMNMIKLYGKPIRVNKASSYGERTRDVGANLFIGNLDPDVDEKLLYDTFSAFGSIISTPKIMRDPETGESRGFGFISFDCFEASDGAIEAMHSQFLCNRPITVSYAIKKDSKTGERHGTVPERMLASKNPLRAVARPHTMFGTGTTPQMGGMPLPLHQGMGGPPTMFPPMPMGGPGQGMPPFMPPPFAMFPPFMPPPQGMPPLPQGMPLPPQGLPPPPSGAPSVSGSSQS